MATLGSLDLGPSLWVVSTAVTAVSQPALPPLPVLLEWGVPGSCPLGLSVPEAFMGRIRLGVPPVMKSWEPRSRRAEGSESSKLLQPCLVQSLAVWRRESHCLHLSVSLQTAQTSSPARGLSPAPPCLPCGAPWQPVITALWQDPEAAVLAL